MSRGGMSCSQLLTGEAILFHGYTTVTSECLSTAGGHGYHNTPMNELSLTF